MKKCYKLNLYKHPVISMIPIEYDQPQYFGNNFLKIKK